MEEQGYRPIQMGSKYGLSGDGGFAYFDLRPSLGIFVELIEIPVRRRSPEAIWTGTRLYIPVASS